MYFCPSCSYSYDITKSSTTVSKDSRIEILKMTEAIKIYDENKDMSKYIALFNRDDTSKNKKYQKFDDKQKVIFNQIFDVLTSSGAEFKCNNCNNIQPITSTVLLYNLNMENKNNLTKTIEENEFICNDPILPRTHDYTCKNPNCITHKDITLKESVFYKEKNSFKVNYICTVCYFSW
jgi:hypothetical protein